MTLWLHLKPHPPAASLEPLVGDLVRWRTSILCTACCGGKETPVLQDRIVIYIYIYRVSTCVNTNCAEIIAGQALAVACWAKLAFVASLLLNYAARPLREFLVAVKVEAIKVRRPDLKIGDCSKTQWRLRALFMCPAYDSLLIGVGLDTSLTLGKNKNNL